MKYLPILYFLNEFAVTNVYFKFLQTLNLKINQFVLQHMSKTRMLIKMKKKLKIVFLVHSRLLFSNSAIANVFGHRKCHRESNIYLYIYQYKYITICVMNIYSQSCQKEVFSQKQRHVDMRTQLGHINVSHVEVFGPRLPVNNLPTIFS